MKKYLMILFFILPGILIAQDCPCDDSLYTDTMKKSLFELTNDDKEYLDQINQKCVEYFFPNYLDCDNWDFLCEKHSKWMKHWHNFELEKDELKETEVIERCYYDKSRMVKNDSIITVPVKMNTFFGDEDSNFSNSFFDLRIFVFNINKKNWNSTVYFSLDRKKSILAGGKCDNGIIQIEENSFFELMFESLLKYTNSD